MVRRWLLLFVLSLALLQPRWAAAHSFPQVGTNTLPTVAAKPVLRRGACGPAVRELQRRLTDWNYREEYPILIGETYTPDFLVIDGVFGHKVETFVRTFQRENGLLEDGVVGAQMWQRLPDLRGSERLEGQWVNRVNTLFSIFPSVKGMVISEDNSIESELFTITLVKESTTVVVFTAVNQETHKKWTFTAQFRDQGDILLTAPGRRAERLQPTPAYFE